MPPTLTIETPTGGLHFIYTHTEMVAQSDLVKTINVRSLGGYLGCPGSWIDGKQYLFRTYTKPTPAPTHIAVKFGAKRSPTAMRPTTGPAACPVHGKRSGPRWGGDPQRRRGPERPLLFCPDVADAAPVDRRRNRAGRLRTGRVLRCKVYRARRPAERNHACACGWAPKNPRADDVFSEIEQAPGTEPPKARSRPTMRITGSAGSTRRRRCTLSISWTMRWWGGWGFLSGVTGSLKTFIVNRLALCVAAQRDFFGRKILERGGTCIIAAEAAYAVPDRLRAGVKHDFQGSTRADRVPGIATQPAQHGSARAVH